MSNELIISIISIIGGFLISATFTFISNYWVYRSNLSNNKTTIDKAKLEQSFKIKYEVFCELVSSFSKISEVINLENKQNYVSALNKAYLVCSDGVNDQIIMECIRLVMFDEVEQSISFLYNNLKTVARDLRINLDDIKNK